ncbi:3-phosphoserine/phosphohydroxythreonine transaminase [Natribacillus halophilus]|uniref:Phosphoserine aminotransferase n=1 Tax=Natribacillus halophilus TaxID=549003 RepID=A0A1G8NWJ9_9BACI|nr:3-phosphoserine/phosphohydroxythreonine transaminase [Natribacillus halophilus]SDI84593.1 phosphoserine aminotransferase apoenzyme [Natribacillus halophilus]
MTTRKSSHNFNAGPAALPPEVLQQVAAELENFDDTGMSIMEHSHRAEPYERVHHEAIATAKRLLGISDDYEVLLLQGGASHQFAMVPYNLLDADQRANYILTGAWSEKAKNEADILGDTYSGGSGKDQAYRRVPDFDTIDAAAEDAYIHVTSNNTIYGTAWQDFARMSEWEAPVVADMSSDIFSRTFPVENFDLIYAGAQKNIGPAGVTVVIISRALLERIKNVNPRVPAILRYDTHADKHSLYHTPPTFAVYMLKNTLHWIEENGGLSAMEARNRQKAQLLYDTIDNSAGFYRGHAHRDSRSDMNVTFTLPTETITNRFLDEAKDMGFSGLNGHRSVGGCRASLYNAVPYESVEALRDFMVSFQRKNQ